MGYVKIWIHAVWNTKRRVKYLQPSVKNAIIAHIRETAEKKGIYIDEINGHEQHIHCLISLDSVQRLDEVVQQLKGESSHWINGQNLIVEKFGWQREYYAVSVGISGIKRVREYIQRQEEHHKRKSYERECEEFAAIYGFSTFVSG